MTVAALAADLSHSASIREESTRRLRKERGRKLRRYLLIGLATVGGGTVIGDFYWQSDETFTHSRAVFSWLRF